MQRGGLSIWKGHRASLLYTLTAEEWQAKSRRLTTFRDSEQRSGGQEQEIRKPCDFPFDLGSSHRDGREETP
jgi:hypothetical protein